MQYLTVKETAKKWRLSVRTIQNYCDNEKIPGAKYIGKQWLIPADAQKPTDGRSKKGQKAASAKPYHFPLFVHSPYFSLRSELDEEETQLLEAEKLYLSGQFADCLVKCREIQDTSPSFPVLFGTYCVIGYASLVLGIYTEYGFVVERMKQLIEKEPPHAEDFKLLLHGLLLHTTKDTPLISEIRPDKLSSDAICYYQYLLIMISLLNNVAESEDSVKFYYTYLRRLEQEEITPLMLSVNAMLSVLCSRIGKEEQRTLFMQKACDIAAKNGWLGLLVKYYVGDYALINHCLLNHDEAFRQTLQKLQSEVMQKWTVIHKAALGISSLPEFTIEQNEILLLIANDIPTQVIMKIKHLSPEQWEKILGEIVAISRVGSADNLKAYGKERLLIN